MDIAAGNALVERIKPIVKQTFTPGVLTGIGGFGALYELPVARFRQPVLVSGTDGVGTKLKLAEQLGRHDTIGIDLVAMCVNDILAAGAEPLFFLDYYATGRLSVERATEVVGGIARGCELAGCALTGGETAEMPGMYAGEDYDLAGFAVGIVEKSAILTPARVQAGDQLIGLASSGPHSNGYSLIRKVLERQPDALSAPLAAPPTATTDAPPPPGPTLGEALLAPTRIYVKPLLALLRTVEVHGIAHITGGGLTENIPRILPPYHQAEIDTARWPRPPVFSWLQQAGQLAEPELRRTFNCGVGLAVCVPASALNTAMTALQDAGETVWHIGEITRGETAEPRVVYA